VFPLFSEAKIVDKNTIKYKDIALYQLFNCFIKEAIKKLKCYRGCYAERRRSIF
jgi:hypothetical protein